MRWPYEIAERDHELQNPTSPDKIRRLGAYLRLGPASRVLDLACGQGGPALILAGTYGCHITGVELRPAFAAAARERIAAAGLADRIDVSVGDAGAYRAPAGGYDAVLCIGAAFVWGHIGEAAAAIAPAAVDGGFVAIGEPYWRGAPPADDEGFVDLPATVERFTSAGLGLTGLVTSSDEDWDHYESQHWLAIDEWLRANPEHPDAPAIREHDAAVRDRYLRHRHGRMNWAILVGRTIRRT